MRATLDQRDEMRTVLVEADVIRVAPAAAPTAVPTMTYESPWMRRLWTPIVGPSAVAVTLAVHDLAMRDIWEVTPDDLGAHVGIAHRAANNGILVRSLLRAYQFGLLSWWPAYRLLVLPERVKVPSSDLADGRVPSLWIDLLTEVGTT